MGVAERTHCALCSVGVNFFDECYIARAADNVSSTRSLCFVVIWLALFGSLWSVAGLFDEPDTVTINRNYVYTKSYADIPYDP